MNTNFTNSDTYKKALEEYTKEIYGELLNPLHSIVIDEDEVYLFYNQKNVEDIFEQFKEIYNISYDENENDSYSQMGINIGCEIPELRTIKFMGNNYKVISLWYDNTEVPTIFKAKF